MSENRISKYAHLWDDETPVEAVPAVNLSQGFVYAPVVQPPSVPSEPAPWQQELYRRAFELAQAERASK